MLGFILVNYNCWPHTIECLESILRSEYKDFHIIVVDNASSDDSVAQIRSWASGNVNAWVSKNSSHRSKIWPPVGKPIEIRLVDDTFTDIDGSCIDASLILLTCKRNGGFGSGNNLGMSCALSLGLDTGYFWLLNNDTVIGPDVIGRILALVTNRPCIWGTWLMEYLKPESFQIVGGCRLTLLAKRPIPYRNPEAIRSLDCLNGASLVFPVSLFRATGGFDERIFMYGEELDLCLRAKRLGYELDVLPIKVYHKGGVSSNSMQQWIWTYRNKFYILHKQFGWRFWVVPNVLNLLLVAFSPFHRFSRGGKRQAIWFLLRGGLFRLILAKDIV